MPIAGLDPSAAIRLLPLGGRVLVAGATGESGALSDAVMAAGDDIAATFTGIFVPGLNRATYLASSGCRVETFFMTPELAKRRDQVEFLPICYQDIGARLRSIPIDAALMMVSPPDTRGRCSFGPAVDFLAELWPLIPLRIAHINPLLPRTDGPTIAIDAIDAVFERAVPLKEMNPESADPKTDRIAALVADYIQDGATLQIGLGKIPGAILRALTRRRNLRIHSGLVGDEVVDLAEAGALTAGSAVTTGVAIGTKRLYDAIAGDTFRFRPASVTHSAPIIAAIPGFVSINSALEVDLLGQAYAEVGPSGVMSGPGGASDFARGARMSVGGLRIVALVSDAVKGTISRIISPQAARGPVSLGRFDIDIVATEYGAADLRGLGYSERACALISISAPAHRGELSKAWASYAQRL